MIVKFRKSTERYFKGASVYLQEELLVIILIIIIINDNNNNKNNNNNNDDNNNEIVLFDYIQKISVPVPTASLFSNHFEIYLKHIPTKLFIYLFIHLFIYIFIYLFIYCEFQ